VALVAVAATLWTLSMSCVTGPVEGYCEADGDCGSASGLQVCDTGQNICVDVECTDDAHCAIRTYCSQSNVCIPGCGSDIGCLAEEHCDVELRACIDDGCTDAQLDCAFGERCMEDGECRPDPSQQACEPCDVGGDVGGTCSFGGLCVPFEDQEPPYEGQGWCFYGCDAAGTCPRGFECENTNVGLGPMDLCMAYCPDLYNSGVLDWE